MNGGAFLCAALPGKTREAQRTIFHTLPGAACYTSLMPITGRKKKCISWNCPNLHTNKNGYCNECNAKYRAKHPEKYKKKEGKIDAARPNARERGYTDKWTKFAKDFLSRHPICEICHKQPAQVCDHKTATARMMMDANGEFSYNEEDYQALCYACNTAKGRTTDKEMEADYFFMKDLLK